MVESEKQFSLNGDSLKKQIPITPTTSENGTMKSINFPRLGLQMSYVAACLSLLAGCSSTPISAPEPATSPQAPASAQETSPTPTREQTLGLCFDLLGGARIFEVTGAGIADIDNKLALVKQETKGRRLSQSVPMLAKKMEAAHPSTTITILGKRQPTFAKIRAIAGMEDSTEAGDIDVTTRPGSFARKLSIVWHNYGAYAFAVSQDKVIALRVQCKAH